MSELTYPIDGLFEMGFTIRVIDEEAVLAYIAQYAEEPNHGYMGGIKRFLKACVWQCYNYGMRTEPAGTDGMADMPEGIVRIDWEDPYKLSIYHDGEWW